MLIMFVCTTRWLSMHLYTLAYMFPHKSCLLVCRPYFNTMKLWTSNPNLHLSVMDTTCLPFCLFAFFSCLLIYLFAFLLSRLFVYLVACHVSCHIYLACLLCNLYTLSTHLFLFIACLLVSCLCLCLYTNGARMNKARVGSPKCKQEGRGCEYVDISQVVMSIGLGV